MVKVEIDIIDSVDTEIKEFAKKSKIKKDTWLQNAIIAYLQHNRDIYGQQPGTLGWKQFMAAKREVIDKFDRAKEIDKSHKTSVYRGIIAESAFRKWLHQFLPKKFGVTAGYIISQVESDSIKLSHFDIIIYNQIESPVYWTEGLEKSRAIPVEYVLGVIEVKSSLTPKAAQEAIEHLLELKRYAEGVDTPDAYPKKYFPGQFFCATVFFEFGRGINNKKIGKWLCKGGDLRGYLGGIILRPKDHAPGAIRLDYIEIEGKRNIHMLIMAGNGDYLSDFIEEILVKLTGERKRSYCSPRFLFL